MPATRKTYSEAYRPNCIGCIHFYQGSYDTSTGFTDDDECGVVANEIRNAEGPEDEAAAFAKENVMLYLSARKMCPSRVTFGENIQPGKSDQTMNTKHSLPEVARLLETLKAVESKRWLYQRTLIQLLKRQDLSSETRMQVAVHPGVLSDQHAREFAVECARRAFQLVKNGNRNVSNALVAADRFARGKDSLKVMLAAQREAAMSGLVPPEELGKMEKCVISAAYIAVWLCAGEKLEVGSVVSTAAVAIAYAVLDIMYIDSEESAGKALFQACLDEARKSQLVFLMDILLEDLPNPGSEAGIAVGCLCSVVDNHYGMGYGGMAGVFKMDATCPVHGTASVAQ